MNTPADARAINDLRTRYERAVATGNQAEANRLYATIACYSPSVLPVCPRCRKTTECRCGASAMEPNPKEVIEV
jgi:hypothetical protein